MLIRSQYHLGATYSHQYSDNRGDEKAGRPSENLFRVWRTSALPSFLQERWWNAAEGTALGSDKSGFKATFLYGL